MSFLTRLDRYVARTAILSVLICMTAFMGLYIVVDAFGRLEDFFRELEGWKSAMLFMTRYYLLHMPLIFLHTGPFAILLGLIFTLVRLQKNNELLAAKASGVSLRRLMAPLLMIGMAVSCLIYANRQWLLPRLADDIEESEKMIVRSGKRVHKIEDLFIKDSLGTWFVIGIYEPDTYACRDVWIISKTGNKRTIRHADSAVLIDGGIQVSSGTDLSDPTKGPVAIKDMVVPTDLCHDDMVARISKMRFRSYTNLLWLYQRRPSSIDLATTLHRSLAFPLITVIIPLIGMSILFFKEGMGTATAVGVAILVSFAYFVLDDLCAEAALQGMISPITGGWGPTGIFSATGLFLFSRIRT